jgi:hypothetical protein
MSGLYNVGSLKCLFLLGWSAFAIDKCTCLACNPGTVARSILAGAGPCAGAERWWEVGRRRPPVVEEGCERVGWGSLTMAEHSGGVGGEATWPAGRRGRTGGGGGNTGEAEAAVDSAGRVAR